MHLFRIPLLLDMRPVNGRAGLCFIERPQQRMAVAQAMGFAHAICKQAVIYAKLLQA